MRAYRFHFAIVLNREPPITVIASVWRGELGELDEASAVNANGLVSLTDLETEQVYSAARLAIEEERRER